MNQPQPFKVELSSWKEIAAYLGVSIRTAQSWEQERGLPILRIPGPRAVVSANADELERWKRSGTAPTPDLPTSRVGTSIGRWPLLLIGFGMVFAAGLLAWPRLHSPTPSNARIEERFLVVVDSSGQELWRKEFPYSLKPQAWSNSQRRIWIGDLDGDGSSEVLFAVRDADAFHLNTPLICYSATGQELWRFVPGRTVRRKDREYPPPYGLSSIAVSVKNGNATIALASHHYPYATAQIALLSGKGELLGSYWHRGHLQEILFGDLNESGHPLLYLGGIDNTENAATLVVLDPEVLRGERQQRGGQFLEMPEYVETRKILFPRSEMNLKFEKYNAVSAIDLMPKRLIVHILERFGAAPHNRGLMYQFDSSLRLREVGSDDGFSKLHSKLFGEGGLKLSESQDLDRLRIAFKTSSTSHSK